MDKEEAGLYFKRKMKYWIFSVFLILLWYSVTGIESSYMGLNPLTRRSFTLFDIPFYILIITGFFILNRWYRKCPKCGKRMKMKGLSPFCHKCKFGTKTKQPGS